MFSQVLINHTDMYKKEIDPVDPIMYWRRIRQLFPSNHGLADIAIELLSFPASAAAVERTFSIVRRVHTWQRNKLGRDTLSKLVYIYVNQRALEKCD
jgi:hypothetical protein